MHHISQGQHQDYSHGFLICCWKNATRNTGKLWSQVVLDSRNFLGRGGRPSTPLSYCKCLRGLRSLTFCAYLKFSPGALPIRPRSYTKEFFMGLRSRSPYSSRLSYGLSRSFPFLDRQHKYEHFVYFSFPVYGHRQIMFTVVVNFSAPPNLYTVLLDTWPRPPGWKARGRKIFVGHCKVRGGH